MERNSDGTFKKIINISREDLSKLYIDNGLSQTKIAHIYNCSSAFIHKELKRHSVKIRELHHFKIHESIKLTKKQLEVLHGAMLGDGNLYKSKNKGANAQLKYLTSSKEHTEYVASFFQEHLTNECLKGSTKRSHIDQRTNKEYTSYYFRTKNNPTFTELYNVWYPNNIKALPNDLRLTPLMCLVWYIGDGGLVNYGELIRINTNMFSKKSLETILLPQMMDFKPYLTYKTNDQWVITIPRIKVESFLNYIGSSPIESMRYKWDFKQYINEKFKNGHVKSHKHLQDEFIALYLNGVKPYRIAKRYDIDQSAVRYYLVKAGIYKK